jgi:hypothetical protein
MFKKTSKKNRKRKVNLKNFCIKPKNQLVRGRSLAGIEGFKSRRGHGCLSYVNGVCCAGRDLCDGPILRPRESYRACHCVWSGVTLTLYTYLWVHRRVRIRNKQTNKEQRLRRSGKQKYFEWLRAPRLFDKFRDFMKFKILFLLSHIPLAIPILRQMSSVQDFAFYNIRMSISTENTYTQFFPKHSPFFRSSRLNLLWISLVTVVATYLVHHILLSLVAVVFSYVVPSLYKAIFSDLFPCRLKGVKSYRCLCIW